jgi:2-octaprenyl-6-methoxyphenol hydroxylase
MTSSSPDTRPIVAVVGGGPTGLTAALGLARRGHRVAIIGPDSLPPDDGRTAAIFETSLDEVAKFAPDVVERLRVEGARLAGIRIVDVTGALVRAPTVTFRAGDLGIPGFGISLPTRTIVRILSDAVRAEASVSWFSSTVRDGEATARGWRLALEDGRIVDARLVVGADGQDSRMRKIAGIGSRRWQYRQHALTFRLAHALDHEDVSTEFHTRHGPFTLVPAGDRQSSVVWMTTPDEAHRLLELDAGRFAREAERQSQYLLGSMQLVGERGHYPMAALRADRFEGRSVALIGEAAHAVPPIGAQGLNLGLRDAASIVGVISPDVDDITSGLAQWARRRERDAAVRTGIVDMVNRSLLAGWLPVDAARGAGLQLLASVGPLRRAVMRLGMADNAVSPRLR